MNEIKKFFETEIPKYGIESAFEEMESVICSINSSKVFHEELSLFVLKNYLYDNENFYFELTFDMPDGKTGKYRREIFPLNYIRVNNYSICALYITGTTDKIFIPKRVFDSEMVADFYVPILLNKTERKASILGYIGSDKVKEEGIIFSDYSYYIPISSLEPIEKITKELAKENDKLISFNFDEFSNLIKQNQERLNSFSVSIKEGKYPESFYDDINMFDEDFYYSLLYSEKQSKKYLDLLNLSTEIINSKSTESKIVNINEIRMKYLSSLAIFNKSYVNKSTKVFAASTKLEIEISVFEFNIDNEKIKDIFIKPEVNITTKNILRLEGLETYSEQKWLVFIDKTEESRILSEMGFNKENYREIFKNWNADFFEKYTNDSDFYFVEGFKTENDKITNDGVLDIKLNDIKLSGKIRILLAILVQENE